MLLIGVATTVVTALLATVVDALGQLGVAVVNTGVVDAASAT